MKFFSRKCHQEKISFTKVSRADWIRTSDLLTPRRSIRIAEKRVSADQSATSGQGSFRAVFTQVLGLSSRSALFSALTLHVNSRSMGCLPARSLLKEAAFGEGRGRLTGNGRVDERVPHEPTVAIGSSTAVERGMMTPNTMAGGSGRHSSESSSERPYRFKTSGMIPPMDRTPAGFPRPRLAGAEHVLEISRCRFLPKAAEDISHPSILMLRVQMSTYSPA
jgi:hypothetical protein